MAQKMRTKKFYSKLKTPKLYLFILAFYSRPNTIDIDFNWRGWRVQRTAHLRCTNRKRLRTQSFCAINRSCTGSATKVTCVTRLTVFHRISENAIWEGEKKNKKTTILIYRAKLLILGLESLQRASEYRPIFKKMLCGPYLSLPERDAHIFCFILPV